MVYYYVALYTFYDAAIVLHTFCIGTIKICFLYLYIALYTFYDATMVLHTFHTDTIEVHTFHNDTIEVHTFHTDTIAVHTFNAFTPMQHIVLCWRESQLQWYMLHCSSGVLPPPGIDGPCCSGAVGTPLPGARNSYKTLSMHRLPSNLNALLLVFTS